MNWIPILSARLRMKYRGFPAFSASFLVFSESRRDSYLDMVNDPDQVIEHSLNFCEEC